MFEAVEGGGTYSFHLLKMLQLDMIFLIISFLIYVNGKYVLKASSLFDFSPS